MNTNVVFIERKDDYWIVTVREGSAKRETKFFDENEAVEFELAQRKRLGLYPRDN